MKLATFPTEKTPVSISVHSLPAAPLPLSDNGGIVFPMKTIALLCAAACAVSGAAYQPVHGPHNTLSISTAQRPAWSAGLPGAPGSAPYSSFQGQSSWRSIAARGGWQWPTGSPPAVLRGFDPPAKKWLAGHRGVDLAYTVGSPIYAPEAGRVAFSGTIAHVTVLSIDHPGGIRTTYQPVKDPLPQGTAVERGQIVGYADAGHDSNALHWGAKIGKDAYINPLMLIFGAIVLKE